MDLITMTDESQDEARMALASPEEAQAAGFSLQTDTNMDKALKAAQAAQAPMRLRITLSFYKGRDKGYVNAHGYSITGLSAPADEATIQALWRAVEVAVEKCAQEGIGPQRVREVLEAL